MARRSACGRGCSLRIRRPTPDQRTRPPTSGLSSLPPVASSGTPWRSAYCMPPYPRRPRPGETARSRRVDEPRATHYLADVAAVDEAVAVRWRAGGRTQPRLRGWIHLCSVPFAVVAALALVVLAPTSTARLAAVVYGVAVCALFTVSSLYHRVRWYAVAHLRMRRLDHGTIFVMIAGTYTPVCLLALSGATGVVLLTIVWTVAAGAFVLSVAGVADRSQVAKGACYIAIGRSMTRHTASFVRAR